MDLTRRHTLGALISFSAMGLAPGMTRLAHAASHESGEHGMSDMIKGGSGDIAIYPVQHASLALKGGGKVIYSDPVGDVSAYADLPKPDLILITHEHGDHYNAETLGGLMGENTKLLANPAVFDMLPADIKSRATKIGNGETTTIIDLSISAIPAYNSTEDRKKYHPEGRDNGYVLSLDGKRIYIAGDTEDIPEMRALTGIDLAFIPMNLPYTMDVEQAASGVSAFAPKVVYPYHYKGSDVEMFKKLVDAGDSGTEVRLAKWY